jgi:hypothetical protein
VIPEYELKNIVTKGRKDVPQATILAVTLGLLPGTVTIRVQLPGQEAWREYPNLQIHNGSVELPVRLAFLSYAKEDARFVQTLSTRLLHDGVLTWFDEKDLLPGDDWKRKIDDAIERSDFVLVFISSVSVTKTGYFQRELKYALEQRQLRPEGARYIIPIIVDKCQVPAALRDIQWLRAEEANWYEHLKQALLS